MAPEQPSLVQLPCAKTQEFCKAEFLDSTPAFASGNSCFISSRVQKLQNSAQAEFWDCTPVLALELGTLFPNSAQAGFGGFGLRLLVSSGFFDAKASLEAGGLCPALA